ncbi:hypothetical protein VITFI_CDS1517 [Vitreoscilla filiformis]|uniref:Uncharacterized protein n=1 Tax=Vitreoscilla filiformis TaxID=63 RepID=A0A221KE89_VITFI|nr:hypothetical protein [Vitreoscilla filiformis]ASM75782.1 hypothetical protein VITFI_CDS0003 [Vitreoscilla filiformis]ASM75906.1 hypothetical protein VITFI_CDS0127 [Vitreoscilla filiformis]ASM76420.1 hypothetical protein VITFI_CDS0641 [Vitreoscilla filiformis]ASM76856.1 hypothetical protein VITFI_CDS1078 [Vitreoscilla filiformis]ASM77295.1 hypothetical protein VITFI_CDS1517 [Vitreoscilla filiformis]
MSLNPTTVDIRSLNEQQRRALLDCTGLSRRQSAYRNSFVVRKGGADAQLAQQLEAKGLMCCKPYLNDHSLLYQVTQAGMDAALAIGALKQGRAWVPCHVTPAQA